MARNLTLSFGLLSFAAKADKAVETPVAMSNLCVGQPGTATLVHEPQALKQPRVCPTCGPIVDPGMLKKGIKQGTSYAVVEQTEVAEAVAEFSDAYKAIVNLAPHPAEEFLPATAPGASINYLTPADDKGSDHYQLLVKLIESHPELAFVALHTPRSKTGLYLVRVHNGVLVLEERVRSESLKQVPSIGGVVNEQLYAMLEQVLGTFVTPYDAEKYEDGYRKALEEMAAKATEVIGATTKESTKLVTPVASDDDLMTKLAALAKAS